MTEIATEHNLRRLSFFLHVDMNRASPIVEWAEFLAIYTRIMDIQGCGRQELSQLFLEKRDFDELKTWAIENRLTVPEKDWRAANSNYFNFSTPTILWHVSLIENYFQPNKIA